MFSLFVNTNGLLGGVNAAGCCIGELFLDLVDGLHVGLDQLVVHVGCSAESGMEQPDESCYLQHVVEGDEVEDASGKLVNHCEQAEHNPVGEPLLIIVRAFRLESVETHEHGVGHSDHVGDDGLADAENHEEHEADQGSLEDLLLGEAGCLRNLF